MTITKILLTTAVMAIVTYLTRVIPLLVFRKPIENTFVKSFLTYLPYAVLSAMIFPDIFTSTASLVSGIIGTVVAVILAYCKRGLVVVALGATLTVFVVEQIMILI